MRLIIEALAVGISSLIVGLILHVLLGYHSQHANSPTMKKEMIQLCILLALTGVLVHFLYEFLGMNKWYCKHGNACLS
jgi:hypothetical protein